MRDYLFANPTLIFEEETWVIPIIEEKVLPLSSLHKKYGRTDIILCRILEEKEKVRKHKKLSLSLIELWVVELKKEEVSYENGFKQLFDYMTIIKNDREIQKMIIEQIKIKVKDYLNIKDLKFSDYDSSINIFGSLVAPSFDLIGRTIGAINKNINKYKKDYNDLEKVLKEKGKINEGFTLLDVINAACKLFSNITLIKLIRFKRGDEIIVYSENILGRKSVAQVSRVDPLALFKNGTLRENDVFYFKDENGREYREVKCKVLNKRGPSHSFMIKIEKIEGFDKIKIPKWDKNKYQYTLKKLPVINTSKTCSIALHKLFNVYTEEELFKYYWNFGENDFIRKSDGKLLSELRELYRDNYM